jgi:hypothetical protein
LREQRQLCIALQQFNWNAKWDMERYNLNIGPQILTEINLEQY